MTASRRVVFVSDSHLSARAAGSDLNWSALVRYVRSARSDLVVHAGDLSLDGAHDPADLVFARSRLDLLDLLGVPWRAVPGNHDVGDSPSSPGPGQNGIDVEHREQWLAAVGPDWWAIGVAGWRLIGINAQLLDSGLAAESGQWDWLQAELRAAPAADRVALVTHKPVAADEPELAAAPPYRFVPGPARSRLAGSGPSDQASWPPNSLMPASSDTTSSSPKGCGSSRSVRTSQIPTTWPKSWTTASPGRRYQAAALGVSL